MTNDKIRPILIQLLKWYSLTLAHHNSIMTKLPHDSTRTFCIKIEVIEFENDNLVCMVSFRRWVFR